MLLQQLCTFFQGVLRILAVNALVVKFSSGSLHLRQNLQHIISIEFSSPDESEEEGSMGSQSAVQTQFHHQRLRVRELLLLIAVERLGHE